VSCCSGQSIQYSRVGPQNQDLDATLNNVMVKKTRLHDNCKCWKHTYRIITPERLIRLIISYDRMFQLSLLGRTFHKASAIFLDNDAFNFGSRLYKSNSPMAYTYSNIFVINISLESNLYISVHVRFIYRKWAKMKCIYKCCVCVLQSIRRRQNKVAFLRMQAHRKKRLIQCPLCHRKKARKT